MDIERDLTVEEGIADGLAVAQQAIDRPFKFTPDLHLPSGETHEEYCARVKRETLSMIDRLTTPDPFLCPE